MEVLVIDNRCIDNEVRWITVCKEIVVNCVLDTERLHGGYNFHFNVCTIEQGDILLLKMSHSQYSATNICSGVEEVDVT